MATGQRKITKAEALQIAKELCAREGWPWEEPVHVSGWWGTWKIMTNSSRSGCNAHIVIRKQDGEVMSKGFAPR